jgi:hypothetical protein
MFIDHPHGRRDQVSLVVYAAASSALAARHISEDHDMWGDFVSVEPRFMPLVKYAQLISETLCGKPVTRTTNLDAVLLLTSSTGSPDVLKVQTSYKVDPIYRQATDATYGFLVPDFHILGQIAPPIPGDAMKRLFEPRTFLKLQGNREGALVLAPHEGTPNPFESDDEDEDDPDRRESVYS